MGHIPSTNTPAFILFYGFNIIGTCYLAVCDTNSKCRVLQLHFMTAVFLEKKGAFRWPEGLRLELKAHDGRSVMRCLHYFWF